jgi:hypothetical protein
MMMQRPSLDPRLPASEFRGHRWLKTELIDFCKVHGLPVEGGKHVLKRRVQRYLEFVESERDRVA